MNDVQYKHFQFIFAWYGTAKRVYICGRKSDIEDFIYSFKDENEEYQVFEVAEAIAEQFKGSIKCATFEPEVDVIV